MEKPGTRFGLGYIISKANNLLCECGHANPNASGSAVIAGVIKKRRKLFCFPFPFILFIVNENRSHDGGKLSTCKPPRIKREGNCFMGCQQFRPNDTGFLLCFFFVLLFWRRRFLTAGSVRRIFTLLFACADWKWNVPLRSDLCSRRRPSLYDKWESFSSFSSGVRSPPAVAVTVSSVNFPTK